MPSKSKSQQRLFGWVRSCQKGTATNCPPNISKVANSISHKDAEDFSRTKHEGLPEKKGKKMKKRLKSYQEFTNDQVVENLNAAHRQLAGMTMGANGSQVRKDAAAASFDSGKPFRLMVKWLAQIEDGLANSGPSQSGEEANNNFHPQAVAVLQNILHQAAAGKRQWSVQQQAKSMKKNMGPATPSVQQQAPTEPTPLNVIGK